jgi:protease I
MFLVLPLMLMAAGNLAQGQEETKKILFVIAPEKFYDDELMVPMRIVEAAGIKCAIASTKTGEIIGVKGGKVEATLDISKLDISSYDAIAVIGGEGAITHLWPNKELNDLVQSAYQKGKLVTGICAGSVVLARAGVLKGIDATCYPIDLMINELKAAEANYVEAKVVAVKNIITANGPDGAEEYGKALVDSLKK